MNEHQALRRVRSVLLARKWLDSGDRVFTPASVVISAMPLDAWWGSVRLPLCLLRPDTGAVDPEHRDAADLIQQGFQAVLAVSGAGDLTGEAALIGAHRKSKTEMEGRGLLEVQAELFAAIRTLGGEDHFRVRSVGRGPAVPEVVENVGYVVSRAYRFEAMISDQASYHEPRGVSVSEAGGTVTISWSAPDDTTDLITYVVRRASGIVPVARLTEGTDVAMSSPLDLSTTDTPGAGTFTYSVFAHYADPGGSVALHGSDYGYATVTLS